MTVSTFGSFFFSSSVNARRAAVLLPCLANCPLDSRNTPLNSAIPFEFTLSIRFEFIPNSLTTFLNCDKFASSAFCISFFAIISLRSFLSIFNLLANNFNSLFCINFFLMRSPAALATFAPGILLIAPESLSICKALLSAPPSELKSVLPAGFCELVKEFIALIDSFCLLVVSFNSPVNFDRESFRVLAI